MVSNHPDNDIFLYAHSKKILLSSNPKGTIGNFYPLCHCEDAMYC